MAGIRALSRRVKRIEKTEKPRPSLIALWCGSFDAWVEKDVLPGIESGALDSDFIAIVACLRAWETDGTWSGRMQGETYYSSYVFGR